MPVWVLLSVPLNATSEPEIEALPKPVKLPEPPGTAVFVSATVAIPAPAPV